MYGLGQDTKGFLPHHTFLLIVTETRIKPLNWLPSIWRLKFNYQRRKYSGKTPKKGKKFGQRMRRRPSMPRCLDETEKCVGPTRDSQQKPSHNHDLLFGYYIILSSRWNAILCIMILNCNLGQFMVGPWRMRMEIKIDGSSFDPSNIPSVLQNGSTYLHSLPREGGTQLSHSVPPRESPVTDYLILHCKLVMTGQI